MPTQTLCGMHCYEQVTLKNIVLGLLLFTAHYCASAQHLKGTYESNFPAWGFFSTEITFNTDGTFTYLFSGDLTQQELSGTYLIRHRDVYLLFDEVDGPIVKVDSVEAKEFERLTGIKMYEYANANYHGRERKEEAGVRFHQKFRYEKKRLYSYDLSTGQLIRTFKYYDSKAKNWILRESYLQRIK